MPKRIDQNRTHCKNGHSWSEDNIGINKKGYQFCKVCLKNSTKEWINNNRERQLGHQRKWQKENKDKVISYQKKWRDENKEKFAEYQKKFRERHPGRVEENQKKWRENNPEKFKAAIKNWCKNNQDKVKEYQYKFKYGLSLDDVNNMAEEQNYRCKICNRKKKLVVDHCHRTEKVRGLLCSACNTGIGLFRENEEVFIAATNYLFGDKYGGN